jgi:hypothetical protein
VSARRATISVGSVEITVWSSANGGRSLVAEPTLA